MRMVRFLLSLALVGVALSWAISYRRDSPGLFHSQTALTVYLERGWVCLSRQPENWAISTGRSIEFIEQGTIFPFSERPSLIARVPLIVPFALTLVLLGYYWVVPVYRVRKRIRAGLLCKKCTYNLTGNVSAACPECGTPVRIGRESEARNRNRGPEQ